MLTILRQYVQYTFLLGLKHLLISPDVNVEPSSTRESSGLYSVKSELSMKVVKEDADIFFHCEITYFVPGGTRMVETSPINITVLCELNT